MKRPRNGWWALHKISADPNKPDINFVVNDRVMATLHYEVVYPTGGYWHVRSHFSELFIDESKRYRALHEMKRYIRRRVGRFINNFSQASHRNLN